MARVKLTFVKVSVFEAVVSLPDGREEELAESASEFLSNYDLFDELEEEGLVSRTTVTRVADDVVSKVKRRAFLLIPNPAYDPERDDWWDQFIKERI